MKLALIFYHRVKSSIVSSPYILFPSPPLTSGSLQRRQLAYSSHFQRLNFCKRRRLAVIFHRLSIGMWRGFTLDRFKRLNWISIFCCCWITGCLLLNSGNFILTLFPVIFTSPDCGCLTSLKQKCKNEIKLWIWRVVTSLLQTHSTCFFHLKSSTLSCKIHLEHENKTKIYVKLLLIFKNTSADVFTLRYTPCCTHTHTHTLTHTLTHTGCWTADISFSPYPEGTAVNQHTHNFVLFFVLSLSCTLKLFFVCVYVCVCVCVCVGMIYLVADETHLACELLISVKMNLISP